MISTQLENIRNKSPLNDDIFSLSDEIRQLDQIRNYLVRGKGHLSKSFKNILWKTGVSETN